MSENQPESSSSKQEGKMENAEEVSKSFTKQEQEEERNLPQVISLEDLEHYVDDRVEEQFAAIAVQFKSFSGPIADPEAMAAYKQIQRDFPDRILKMAELEQIHRHNVDNQKVKSDIYRSTIGLWLGFAIAVFIVSCGTILVFNGHDWAGGIITSTTTVSIIALFVTKIIQMHGSSRTNPETSSDRLKHPSK